MLLKSFRIIATRLSGHWVNRRFHSSATLLAIHVLFLFVPIFDYIDWWLAVWLWRPFESVVSVLKCIKVKLALWSVSFEHRFLMGEHGRHLIQSWRILLREILCTVVRFSLFWFDRKWTWLGDPEQCWPWEKPWANTIMVSREFWNECWIYAITDCSINVIKQCAISCFRLSVMTLASRWEIVASPDMCTNFIWSCWCLGPVFTI